MSRSHTARYWSTAWLRGASAGNGCGLIRHADHTVAAAVCGKRPDISGLRGVCAGCYAQSRPALSTFNGCFTPVMHSTCGRVNTRSNVLCG
ncbi:hypothetical protein ACFPRL_16550 [Pseudoclavibacter helvolus]